METFEMIAHLRMGLLARQRRKCELRFLLICLAIGGSMTAVAIMAMLIR